MDSDNPVTSLTKNSQIISYHQLKDVGYWHLDQLLSESRYSLSPFFSLYLLAEVAAILDETHQTGVPYSRLTANNVLVTPKLGIYLLKHHASVALTEDDALLRSLQNDMREFGFLALELVFNKRNNASNFPKVVALKEAYLNSLDESNLKILYRNAKHEISEAFKKLDKKRERIKSLVLHCLSTKNGKVPTAKQAGNILCEELRVFVEHKKITVEKGLKLVQKKLFDSPVYEMLKKTATDKLKLFLNSDSLYSDAGVNDDTISLSDTIVPQESLKTSIPKASKRVQRTGRTISTKQASRRQDPDLSDFDSDDDGALSSFETSKDHQRVTLKKTNSGPKPSLFKAAAGSSEFGDSFKLKTKTKVSERARSQDKTLDKAISAAKPVVTVKGNQVTQPDVKPLKAITSDKIHNDKIMARRYDPKTVASLCDVQKPLVSGAWNKLLNAAIGFFVQDSNVLELSAPIAILGDIHGKYFDLRNMLNFLGTPSKDNQILVLGDMVDRGSFSCETFLYLLSLKVHFPHFVHLLRGNHECKSVSESYGFKDECLEKYGEVDGSLLYQKSCEVFRHLPIAAIINSDAGRLLCVHGGIGENITSLRSITEFNRFVEPEDDERLCDILWADPINENITKEVKNLRPYVKKMRGLNATKKKDNAARKQERETEPETEEQQLLRLAEIDFTFNTERQVSSKFGYHALNEFLTNNGLAGIIRAHQVMFEGFSFHFQKVKMLKTDTSTHVSTSVGNSDDTRRGVEPEADAFPPVITVFSSPNYANGGNKAAVLKIHKKLERDERPNIELLDFFTFDAVEEPNPAKFTEIIARKQFDESVHCPFLPFSFGGLFNLAMELNSYGGRRVLSLKGFDLLAEYQKQEEEHEESLKRDAGNWNDISSIVQERAFAMEAFNDTESVQSFSEFYPNKQSELLSAAEESLAVTTDLLKKKSKSLKVKYKDSENGDLLDRAFLECQLKESDVSFSKRELVGLHTLFMNIATRGKLTFDADDVAIWGDRERFLELKDVAELIVKVMDLDGDNAVGFEDYLRFGAMAKKLWIVKKYNELHK